MLLGRVALPLGGEHLQGCDDQLAGLRRIDHIIDHPLLRSVDTIRHLLGKAVFQLTAGGQGILFTGLQRIGIEHLHGRLGGQGGNHRAGPGIGHIGIGLSAHGHIGLPDGIAVTEGDVVAVEGMPGHDVGIVSLTGEACRLQMKKKRVDPTSENIRKLFRRARPLDIEKWAEAVSEENAALFKTRRIAEEMNLVMKINDVEMQGDRCKAIFYYTADERVDFRGLIKVLAEEFHVRVEMKQIGVRQEASKVGGLGTCGRELCCCTWLTNFQSVTTSVAKAQQILPNPQKLAGQCGKLKCCLNFEYDVYIDALKDFPPAGTPIRFQKGLALYKKTDVFRGIMWYAYENEGDLYAIPAESVKKIIEMNRNPEYPERLEDFQVELMSTSALAQESSEAEFDQELKRMADSGKEVVAEEARPERGRGRRPERGERSEGGDRRRGLRGEGGNRQSRQEGGERRHGPRQGDRQERPRRQNDGAPRRERSSNSQTNGNETPRHE